MAEANNGIADSGLRKKRRPVEILIQSFLFLSAVISILVTVGIVYELGKESLLFFSQTQWENTNKVLTEPMEINFIAVRVSESGASVEIGERIRIGREIMLITDIQGNRIYVDRGVAGTEPARHAAGLAIETAKQATLAEFFTRTEWNPQVGKFGIWALVNATLMTTLIAALFALPLGLGIAIYLSEYATDRVRATLKPILEILAGVPTVVLGYFALTFVTPLLRFIFGSGVVEIYNTASAGIVIGILIIPFISSISEDALSAVPNSLRYAAYALGATRFETAIQVVLPAAFSGVAAAFIVGISRAIGETMIVAIAAGAGPKFTFNPFAAAETMTGHIVRISGGDLSYDSLDYNSIFAIGLMLFFMTLALNVFSQVVVRRFREEYD
jgi:phosphate transport system permease protein